MKGYLLGKIMMDNTKYKKYKKFLDNVKTNENAELIDAIMKGFDNLNEIENEKDREKLFTWEDYENKD